MFLSESYRKRMLELAGVLSESKKSEEQGLNILSKSNVNNAEDVISKFASGDRSNNQKNIPVMAFLYVKGYTDVKNASAMLFGIIAASSTYSKLTDLPRIPAEEVAAVKTDEPFSNSTSPLFQVFMPCCIQRGTFSYIS